MVQESGQTSLLPHWATFWGAMICCATTLVALSAVTARGTQTMEEDGEQGSRKRCRGLRALCSFMCARRNPLVWWKAVLLRIALVTTASVLSSALSLLVTNVTANESEPIRETIRIIVQEMLGVSEEAREKREADCFDTNDSSTRCSVEEKMASQVCEFTNLLESHLDSPLPPTCTIMVAILLFATMAALALSVTAATTLICHKVGDKFATQRGRLHKTCHRDTGDAVSELVGDGHEDRWTGEQADSEDEVMEHVNGGERSSSEEAVVAELKALCDSGRPEMVHGHLSA